MKTFLFFACSIAERKLNKNVVLFHWTLGSSLCLVLIIFMWELVYFWVIPKSDIRQLHWWVALLETKFPRVCYQWNYVYLHSLVVYLRLFALSQQSPSHVRSLKNFGPRLATRFISKLTRRLRYFYLFPMVLLEQFPIVYFLLICP